MTKPGPMNWATNDVWAAGPDAGDDTKLEPTAGQIGEGYYTGRRPSPQIRNWLDHRAGILASSHARAMLTNLQTWDASAFVTAGLSLLTFGHAYDQVLGRSVLFFADPAAAQIVQSANARLYDPWAAGANIAVLAIPTRLDADGSADSRIAVVSMNAGGGDVRFSDAGGAFGVPTAPPPVGQNWSSIACDRDTYGNGWSHWMVGDRPGGGACQIFESVSVPPASVWAANAAFNALALANDIDGIFNTKHPQYALGPSDTGQPAWLVITPTNAVRSTDDGASWTVAAHGLAGNFGPRSAAYSRTSARWVMPVGNAGGDIAYSDDFGATWTTLAGAVTTSGTKFVDIAGDGYGSFVVNERGASYINVSVDEGLTWTEFFSPDASVGAFDIVAESYDSSVNVDDTPAFVECITIAAYDVAGGMSVYHTLG